MFISWSTTDGPLVVSNENDCIQMTVIKFLTLIDEFLGPSPSAISRKKSKAQKHIQIDAMLRSGFFRKMRWMTVPRFGFFGIHV